MTGDIYRELKTAFERERPRKSRGDGGVYEEPVCFFRVSPPPERRAVYKDYLRNQRKTRRVDWELLDRCWRDEHREFQYFVVDHLFEMRKALTFEDMPALSNTPGQIDTMEKPGVTEAGKYL